MDSMHAVVTGGAGFIGSYVAARLLKLGHRVTILDNLSTGRMNNIPEGVGFVEIDLSLESHYERLKDLCCDAVFHLAGQSSGEASFKDPLYDFRSHAVSTFLLLDWCRRKGIPRFLYTSSMSVYGDPASLPVNENAPYNPKTYYAAGKIAAEAYIKLYQTLGLNTTIFRLFSVYGPGQNLNNRMQGIVSIYLSFMLEQKPVAVKGQGGRFRDLVFIEDVIEAFMLALDNPVSFGKTYNVASGSKTTVDELLSILKSAYGDEDYPVEYENGTPGDQFGVTADIARIRSDLHWMPKTDLQAGIKKMVDYEKGRFTIE